MKCTEEEDEEEEYLGGLHDEVDVALVGRPPPPVRNVLPVQAPLVEQDCIKVLLFLQLSICSCKTASLRAEGLVERLPAKT